MQSKHNSDVVESLLSRRHVSVLYWAIFRSKLASEETIQCAFTTKGGSLQLQRDLVVLQYSIVS